MVLLIWLLVCIDKSVAPSIQQVERRVASIDSAPEKGPATRWVGGSERVVVEVKKLADDMVVSIASDGFRLVAFGNGHRIEIEDGVREGVPGAPAIPIIVHGFECAPGNSAYVTIDEATYNTYTNIDLIPEGVEVRPDDKIFDQEAFWPPEMVSSEEAYVGRRKLVRLAYRPFQYNPVTRELRHYHQIKSRIQFKPERPAAHKASFKMSSNGFDDDAAGGAVAGDCDCSEPVIRIEDLISPPTGQAHDFFRRRAGADFNACFKVRVAEVGIHRLTYGNLLAAGVPDAELVGNNLRMFYGDREIAISVSNDGKFSSSSEDHVSFYAEPFRSNYSNDNYYWLGFGAGGLRMMDENAPDVGDSPPVREACRRVTVDQGEVWFDNLVSTLRDEFVDIDDGIYDGWFLKVITESSTGTESIFFSGTDHAAAGLVNFEATVFGVASFGPDQIHHFNVRNQSGNVVFNTTYNGVVKEEISQSFSSSLLNAAGVTRFDITGSATHIDRSALQFANITFQRDLYATGDALSFGGTMGDHRYEVDGLSTTVAGDLWLLDVSDGYEPIRLAGFSTFSSGGNAGVRFRRNTVNNPCYFAAGPSGLITVPSSNIMAAKFGDLSDTSRQHDYIAVVPAAYEVQARRVLEHRDQLALDVMVVTDEEIYNEFGYGIKHPAAFQQFFGYAFHHWVKEPSYVFLVGDGHYDPLNRDTSIPDVLPSFMKVVSFSHAPVDSYYVQVNGDDKLADMAIGRAPVNNLSQLQHMVDKMIAHDDDLDGGVVPDTWRSRIQFVADNKTTITDPDFDADTQSDIIDAFVDSPYVASTTFLPDSATSGSGQVATARSAILNAFNAGRHLVAYLGHGATAQWASENMFDGDDITGSLAANTVFPIVTIFSCQNGVYHLPETTPSCLAESFVLTANKGAVAVIAPSALADHFSSLFLSRGFYSAALDGMVVDGFSAGDLTYTPADVRTLGEAYLSGQAGVFLGAGSAAFELEFYNIFGDPATLVRQP